MGNKNISKECPLSSTGVCTRYFMCGDGTITHSDPDCDIPCERAILKLESMLDGRRGDVKVVNKYTIGFKKLKDSGSLAKNFSILVVRGQPIVGKEDCQKAIEKEEKRGKKRKKIINY